MKEFAPGGAQSSLKEVILLKKDRALDKREYLMIIFLISHGNHML